MLAIFTNVPRPTLPRSVIGDAVSLPIRDDGRKLKIGRTEANGTCKRVNRPSKTVTGPNDPYEMNSPNNRTVVVDRYRNRNRLQHNKTSRSKIADAGLAQPQQVQTQQTFPQQNRRPIVDQPAQVNQSPRQQGNGRINNGETQRINDRRQQQGTWGTSQNTNDRSVGDQRNNNGRYQQIDRRQQEQLQQQRVNQYNQQWKNSQTIKKPRYRQLQEQRRNAYLRYQQRYWERLRRDQIRLQQARYYDNYYNNYRYNRGGNSYYTSQYGAQMLRDAVNNGYEEGFYAGQADRQDGWRSDYNNSYGYQDAAYGYDSYYVSMEEYNYYFREGFRRGYEDGYYSRNRYGNYSNGKYTILGAVIGAIIDIIAD